MSQIQYLEPQYLELKYYTLPTGTVLSVGTQILNALFIPTDLVDYKITSAIA